MFYLSTNLQRKIFLTFLIIWLVLMAAFPNKFTGLKYISLIILAISSILQIHFVHNWFTIGKLSFFVIWYGYFLFSSIIGVINGFPFSLTLARVYFLSPIVVIIISTALKTISIDRLVEVLLWITVGITLIDGMYYLNVFHIIPGDVFIQLFAQDDGQNIQDIIDASNGGIVPIRLDNFTALMFLIPFLLVMLIDYGKNYSKKKKYLLGVTFVLAMLEAILGSRKALEFVSVFGLIIAFFLKGYCSQRFMPQKLLKYGGYLASCMIVIIILAVFLFSTWFGLSAEDTSEWMANMLLEPLMNESVSAQERSGQILPLLSSWSDSVLVGNGLSAYNPDFIRVSSDSPEKWSYEWVYLALGMQTGLVGLMIFFSTVFIIIYSLICKGKTEGESGYYAIAMGFFCFIVAGATNPFVTTLWPWVISSVGLCGSVDLKSLTDAKKATK